MNDKSAGVAPDKGNRIRRMSMSVLGVLVCGISVGFFKRSAFGVDPFQSLMNGLASVLPVNFGLLYVMVNVCLLSFSLIFDRKKIGIATLINLFLLGYVADFSHNMLLSLFPAMNLLGRSVMLIIGIAAMCLASSFYFTADLGVSTYDAVALIIYERWKPAQFRFCRIVCDFICVIAGVLLFMASGKPFNEIWQLVGIGTIITAFFMGPLIEYFNVHVAQPFLARPARNAR